MNEQEIQELYANLPENSKGREADNPERFQFFFDAPHINKAAWPFLLVCHDVHQDNYTWHMGCYEYSLEWWKDTGRLALEMYVSRKRNRFLQFVEIMDREGNHYFIE